MCRRFSTFPLEWRKQYYCSTLGMISWQLYIWASFNYKGELILGYYFYVSHMVCTTSLNWWCSYFHFRVSRVTNITYIYGWLYQENGVGFWEASRVDAHLIHTSVTAWPLWWASFQTSQVWSSRSMGNFSPGGQGLQEAVLSVDLVRTGFLC